MAVQRSEIRAEMVAQVHSIVVPVGAVVRAGDTVVLLESMKMEIPVNSEIDGRVLELAVAPGDVIHEGDLIAVVSND
ncbi:MAG: biotin/lipoyl-binding carrier protein [Candidatus Nanopelagicales bacterium]|jgi:acetyl-CoA carboxylase biotin carboxyl carrier protein|nr:biotin/lipoyl-binding carrier protein [Candidatus Nanopelagicales bacterium]